MTNDAQLAQVGADELLGEDEDVVLQQPEELQAALFFAVEHRRGARGQLRHLLARLADPAAEDAVLERVALGAAGLGVDGADAARDVGEVPRQVERVREPEHGVVVGEQVRDSAFSADLHELRDVRGHGEPALFSFDARAIDLPGRLLGQPAVELRSSSFITGASATGKPRAGGCVSSAGKILYGCGSSSSARGNSSSQRPLQIAPGAGTSPRQAAPRDRR